MKSLIAASVLAVGCTACAAQKPLGLPPLPEAPKTWLEFEAPLSGSECLDFKGAYLEPPLVHRIGIDEKYLAKDNEWIFFGYIPLHRGDRTVHAPGTYAVPRHGFVIRQTTAAEFDLLFYNHEGTSISDYLFRSEEGDFECSDGYIEFPTQVTYGMSEAGLLNFQVRNVLLLDETGALVIQSTRGPYRGTPSQMQREVSYEFIRYPRAESANP